MTQAEFVDHVAATVPLSPPQTETVIMQGLQASMAPLQAGERVAWRGFGRVPLRHRPPRAGRTPSTGDTVQMPATPLPACTAGKVCHTLVHNGAATAGASDDGVRRTPTTSCEGTLGTILVRGFPRRGGPPQQGEDRV
jgi:DNA-binding protein HU-beta